MARLASLLALAALVVSSSPVAAKCAMSHLRPSIVTSAPIVAGGGIVVATVQARYDETDEGDAVQPTWRLDLGGTQSAPKIDVLAPGLAVYRVPSTAGAASLVAGKTVLTEVTTSKDKPAALAAPTITSIVHTRTLGRRASAFTTVTLAAAPPAGMVALVLADAKGKPRSFGLVDGSTEVTVYAHHRCGVVPNNTVESRPGDKVTLFWVDQSGRLSPASKVVTITGTTKTQED